MTLETHLRYKLGTKSRKNLVGLHSDLVLVVGRAIQICECDFTVAEGLRTLAKQQEYFNNGATKTMNSRHLTGHAVDLFAWIDGKISWDWKYYNMIAVAMKQAAAEIGVAMDWGGDWTSFKDGPHYELDWKVYPK